MSLLMNTTTGTAGIAHPSVVGRAALSISLLLGFYVIVAAMSLVLLVIPVITLWLGRDTNVHSAIWLIALCWIPGLLLLTGLFRLQRPTYTPDGRRLSREDASALIDVVEQLASAAGTVAPREVVLTENVELSVTQRGGFLVQKPTRTLIVGAPLLAVVTVDELSAGIAHELGHFAFGDTRLLGIVSLAHAAFRGVLSATKRSPFADSGVHSVEIGMKLAHELGDFVVGTYARVFLRLTLPADRRAELAADQLAARLVGVEPALRLLEKVARAEVLYHLYVREELASVWKAGAVPRDPLAGFVVFSDCAAARCLESRIRAALRTRADPYDTHPTLADRSEALRNARHSGVLVDSRPATSLVSLDLDRWLAERMLAAAEAIEPLARRRVVVPWAEVPTRLLAPRVTAAARQLAEVLFELHQHARDLASMFAAVVRDAQGGRLESLVFHIEPGLRHMPAGVRHARVREVGAFVLARLFEGALLERGATIESPLGEDHLRFRFEADSVVPVDLVSRSADDAVALDALVRWADRLAGRDASVVHRRLSR